MLNEELNIIDAISIASFIMSILNYGENLTQSDKQELMHEFNENTKNILIEIHEHLERQDEKIEYIISKMEGGK